MSFDEEYLAADHATPAAIIDALDGDFRLGEIRREHHELTFYDTFDGLLYAAGIELALPDGGAFPAEARAAAEGRALIPLARVDVETTMVGLLDELDKTVARVELIVPGQLAPRLRIHALRGYEAEATAIVARLGLPPAEQSLRDTAIIAAGGRPEGISAKVRVDLDADMSAEAAVVAVLSALWEVIDANFEGTIADADHEFLHDLRVSVRKTRAVLKELKGVFDPAALADWRAEFKWLQQVTGDSRDLDVMLEDFDELTALVVEEDRAALEPMRTVIGLRRQAARRAMVRELRDERTRRIAVDWPRFLTGLDDTPARSRPDARLSVDAVTSARIAKVYRRMVKMGRAIEATSPAEEYHELRKLGKELRYLLELFGEPLHDKAVVKPMIKALKDLQDVLGRHQDREVQAHTVRAFADEVVGLPGGPRALIAMGALIKALGADEQAARGEFAEAFASFSSASQRRLVKATFAR